MTQFLTHSIIVGIIPCTCVNKTRYDLSVIRHVIKHTGLRYKSTDNNNDNDNDNDNDNENDNTFIEHKYRLQMKIYI